jgi:general secretion pathway protein G
MAFLMRNGKSYRFCQGFTLIELLVVMAIMGLLLSIAAPRYTASVGKAQEAALRTNLKLLRQAIDQYHADHQQYPDELQDLVAQQYLRHIPADPMLDGQSAVANPNTWALQGHPDGQTSGIYDVHSTANQLGQNGTPVAQW